MKSEITPNFYVVSLGDLFWGRGETKDAAIADAKAEYELSGETMDMDAITTTPIFGTTWSQAEKAGWSQENFVEYVSSNKTD